MSNELDDLFDVPPIPREEGLKFMSGLKVAVSDLWVHKATQAAAKTVPGNRLAETARSSMKAILDVSKKGGPKAEEHARKRMHVRHGVRAEMLDRAGSMAKAAAVPVAAQPEEAPPEVPQEEPQEQGNSDEVAIFMGQLVSHEFKMHQWYTYYSELLKGIDREGLADLMGQLAYSELEDAKYFVRRLSVVAPDAVIPVVPNPKPMSDAKQIASTMLQEEQRAIVLLNHLHQLCGDDPMRFQLEQMITDEQVHADKLQRFLGGDKKLAAKLAAAKEQVKQNLVVQPAEQDAAQELAVQELQAQGAQLTNENAALQQRLQEVSSVAQEHAQMAQQATDQAQQLGEQAAAAQEQAAMSDEQAQMNMQEAMAGQQAAAMESDAKSRLAIRIQQMRQQLSQLVAADPVVEEGADAPAIPTTTQMGMGDPMAQDPAAQDPAMDPAAQDPAAEQAAPAEAAPAAEPAKPAPKDKKPTDKDSKVEVKVAAFPKALGRASQLLSGSRAKQLGRAASENLNEAQVHVGRAKNFREAAKSAPHSGQRKMQDIAARNAERDEGTAMKRHWDSSAAAKAETKKVNIARAGVAGAATGVAAGTGGTKEAAWLSGKALETMRGGASAASHTAGSIRKPVVEISRFKPQQLGKTASHGAFKEKGIKRVGQLLSGSRADALLDMAQNKSKKLQNRAVMGNKRTQAQGELKKIVDNYNSEGTKVHGTRLGLVGATAGAGAAGGAIASKIKEKKKEAADSEALRTKARRAAGREGTLPGAAAGLAASAISHAKKLPIKLNPLHAAAAGGILGHIQGRRQFNAQDTKSELTRTRGIEQRRAERHEKKEEKVAEDARPTVDKAKLLRVLAGGGAGGVLGHIVGDVSAHATGSPHHRLIGAALGAGLGANLAK